MSAFSAEPHVGLVIRSRDLELLAYDGTKVVASVHVPLESKEPGHLAQAIRNAFAIGQVRPGKVAVAVLTPEAITRFFTIPLIPKQEWQAAVQFEARKYIPFRTDELVWDYRVNQVKGAKNLEVCFTAIQKDSLQRILSGLEAADVKPTVVEAGSVSLARLTGSVKRKSLDEFLCMVSVSEDSAHLVIVKDRIPYLARDVGIAVKPMGLAPGEGPAEAVAALRESGAALPQASSAPLAAEDQRARRLLSEITISIDFFTHVYQTATITNVFLFGEDATLEPWCQWFSEQLRSPVELGTSLLPQRAPGTIPLSVAVALGVLQRVPQERASLDFLARSQTPLHQTPERALIVPVGFSRSFKIPVSHALASAVLVVWMLLVIWFYGSRDVLSTRRSLQQLVGERAKIGWGVEDAPRDVLQTVRTLVQTQRELLQQTVDRRESMAAKLDALAHLLPDGVWFTEMVFEDLPDRETGGHALNLTVKGACFLGQPEQELAAIQEFADRIKRDPRFFQGFQVAQIEEVQATVDEDRGITYQTFRLNCKSSRKM